MAQLDRTDRRQLLRLAAAVAGASWWPRSAAAQPRIGFDPFGLGVASGSPAPDSVVLWTRLVPTRRLPEDGRTALPVRWEVAHDEGFHRIARSGTAQAVPQLAHSVHVEADGLEPDRWYFYRFHLGEATSPVGRTRTLPAPDALPGRLRVGYASCQRWEHGYYAAHRHLRADQPDLVLFLGDYIYEYPNAAAAIRSFPTLGWVRTLPEYRERYELHRSDADLRALHAACPWLVTWDDHEVQNDYAGTHAGDPRPLSMNMVADFGARRAAAYQAFYEHMPIRASEFALALAGGARADLRVHARYRHGRLADLLLLDGRQYRHPQACAPADRRAAPADPTACPALDDPSRSLLGAAQEQWLEQAFAQAGPGWTVIGQQTLFGQRDLQPGAGEVLWNDGWDGYRPARRRLTDALQRHAVANPVFLGGDVHEHWVGHVKADYGRPDSAVVGVEFCGTSVTSRPGSPERTAIRLKENPHFVFADGLHRGYGLVDFTPQRLTATLRGLDDATVPFAQARTLATFVVEAGRKRLVRA
ncbi:MAG TPA: alkaline phosphatase D family protein [Ramlibacter sp.]|nr:alkaline phosphatase D family protein [Ramlibacter sp.]